MDKFLTFLTYALVLFAVCMLGSYLPQIRTLSDKSKHFLIALSAGIFLALVFWLFLPETYEMAVEEGGHDFEIVSYVILGGFLLVAFIDTVIKHKHCHSCSCELHQDEHSHELISISSFIALSIHAIFDGLALAAFIIGGETLGIVALAGMCIHKFVETFSLSSTLLLSEEGSRTKWLYLTGFSLITPIFGTLFFLFMNGMEVEHIAGLPMAFATGTFMFVTFCSLIPEAFHRKEHVLESFLVIIIGVAFTALCMSLVTMMGGHLH